VIYGVGCINGFNMDSWYILPKLMDYESPNSNLEELVELVIRINELMEVIGVFVLSEMLDIHCDAPDLVRSELS